MTGPGVRGRPSALSPWRRLLPAAAAIGLIAAAGCAHGDPFRQIDASRYELMSVDGDALALAAQRGRVVIVGFFSTWCFPCVAESELMQNLQNKYGDRLVVLGIGLDLEGATPLKLYRDQLRLTFPVLVADQATREGRSPFGQIPVLPTTFILDKSGRVRDGFVGLAPAEDLDKLVARLADE